MVNFLNMKVKTHIEDTLQYIFDENIEKNVILGYSIVSRRSPPLSNYWVFVLEWLVGAASVYDGRGSLHISPSGRHPSLLYVLFSGQPP